MIHRISKPQHAPRTQPATGSKCQTEAAEKGAGEQQQGFTLGEGAWRVVQWRRSWCIMLVAAMVVVKVSLKVTKAVGRALALALPCSRHVILPGDCHFTAQQGDWTA